LLEIGVNYIPRVQRVLYVLLACFLIFYGLFGVITDNLVISYRRGNWQSVTGGQAKLMYCLWLCVSSYLLSKVFNYYDPRDNHKSYVRMGNWSVGLGVCFFYLSLFYGL